MRSHLRTIARLFMASDEFVELTHAALQALGMVMAVIVAHRQITQIDALKSGTDFAGKVFQKMRSEDRGMMGGGARLFSFHF